MKPKRPFVKRRTYVTERVVNIKELENYIEEAHLSVCSLMKGIAEKQLSDLSEVYDSLRKIDDVLVKACEFEFCVERRKTIGRGGGISAVCEKDNAFNGAAAVRISKRIPDAGLSDERSDVCQEDQSGKE